MLAFLEHDNQEPAQGQSRDFQGELSEHKQSLCIVDSRVRGGKDAQGQEEQDRREDH